MVLLSTNIFNPLLDYNDYIFLSNLELIIKDNSHFKLWAFRKSGNFFFLY